jgi:hypothetical protein
VAVVPRDLDDWTLDTIKILVRHHAYEPGRFDFKETLNSKGDPEWNAKIAKAVCSMANSDGGFLIFGVRDRLASDAARIVGIPTGQDHAKEFGQKIAKIQPEIHFESVPRPIQLQGTAELGVFVVHIPLSARRPHMVRTKGVFYIRGDGGSARGMDYYEVRDQMLRTEELAQQVSLVRIKLAQWEGHCRELVELDARGMRSFYGRFDTESFDGLLSTVCVVLPSDRELLSDLLTVSSKAQELNQRLNRWHFNDLDGHQLQSDTPEATAWSSQVGAAANRLLFMCDACEYRLGEHFGPLSGKPFLDGAGRKLQKSSLHSRVTNE